MENRMRSEHEQLQSRQEQETDRIGRPFDEAGAKLIGVALSIYWNDFNVDRFVLSLFAEHGTEGGKRKKEYPGTTPKARGRIQYAGVNRNIR